MQDNNSKKVVASTILLLSHMYKPIKCHLLHRTFFPKILLMLLILCMYNKLYERVQTYFYSVLWQVLDWKLIKRLTEGVRIKTITEIIFIYACLIFDKEKNSEINVNSHLWLALPWGALSTKQVSWSTFKRKFVHSHLKQRSLKICIL